MIFDDLQSVGRKDGLNSLEIPKAIKVSSTLFSIENELLTPTFKIKRPFAKTFFMQDIIEMYSKLPA
jgi:long-chain acyl-CoA synthetase